MKNIFVGTSGFSYKGWSEKFYPGDLPQKMQLEFYAQHYNSVEINSSFYHLPKKETFASWKERTPDNFYFAIKGSRYITQMLKLKNVEGAVESFFENADALKTKLSVVLWQFPAGFHADAERLKNFSQLIRSHKAGKNTRHAFEFRHQSWFTEDIYKILRKHNFSLVIAHSDKWPVADEVTADFIYLRFHAAPDIYASSYTDEELKKWAHKAKEIAAGKDLYAYFNNDARGFAIPNAQTFKEMLT
jgi:uncharacterized protein YecE (DUF72 family)